MFAAAAMFAAASCAEELVEPTVEINKDGRAFTAVFDGEQTKAVLKENVKTFWQKGDEIFLMDGTTSAAFATDITKTSQTATFYPKGDVTLKPEVIALYGTEATGVDMETLTVEGVSLNHQFARAGSFSDGGIIAIAHSESDVLEFKNATALLKFRVKNTNVKAVRIVATGRESITGTGFLSYNSGEPVFDITDGHYIVPLSAENDVFRRDTDYYIAVLPQTLKSGFEIHFQFTDVTEFAVVKSYEKSVDFRRNVILNLGELEYTGEMPADNWYIKGTDGNLSVKMTAEEDYYVYRGLTLDNAAELSFNLRYSFGGEYAHGGHFTSVNAAFPIEYGSTCMVPAGTYDVYLSSKTNKVFFRTEEYSPIFKETFYWVKPWADEYGSADSVGENSPSGNAPNVYTQATHLEGGVAGYPAFLTEFADRGYEDVNPDVKSFYTQRYYLKFGKTNNHTGIRLPVLDIPGTADVQLSFDWAAHMRASGVIDKVKLVVELEGDGTCGDSGKKISHPFVTTQIDGNIVWQDATLSLLGVTSNTRIVIRPTVLDNSDEVDQKRWYLDNILIDNNLKAGNTVRPEGVDYDLLAGTDGNGKVWVMDSSVMGHLGCGPDVSGSDDWWSVNPDEKTNTGMYDDEITFFPDGRYVYDSGADGKLYVNNTVTAVGSGSEDGNDFDIEWPLTESTYTYDGKIITLAPETPMVYVPSDYVWSNPVFHVAELTETTLKLVAENPGCYWQMIFRARDAAPKGPEKLWTVNPVTDLEGYDASKKVRLAKYGDYILVANTTKVYALNPADGSVAVTYNMPEGTTFQSFCVDDAGNIVVTTDCVYGETMGIYLIADPANPQPVLIKEWNTENYYGYDVGNLRIKGDVKGNAVMTVLVSSGAGGAVIMWEIENGECSTWYGVNPPYEVNAVACGCVAPLGTKFEDGLIYAGYGGDYNIKYLANPVLDNYENTWATSYVTGYSWMENMNCLATAEYEGKKYAAFTAGCHFDYDSADAILLDITDSAAAKLVYSYDGYGDVERDGEGANLDWTNLGNHSDILLVPTDDALLMVYVDTNYGAMSCIAVR